MASCIYVLQSLTLKIALLVRRGRHSFCRAFSSNSRLILRRGWTSRIPESEERNWPSLSCRAPRAVKERQRQSGVSDANRWIHRHFTSLNKPLFYRFFLTFDAFAVFPIFNFRHFQDQNKTCKTQANKLCKKNVWSFWDDNPEPWGSRSKVWKCFDAGWNFTNLQILVHDCMYFIA